MFRVGALTLASRAFLAPLEGVSDVGFRALCARHGAGLTFTEMVRASAVSRRNAAALALIDTYDDATPTGVQLLASTPDELLGALRVIEELAAEPAFKHFLNIRALDLNFGCPSPAVLRDGAGPALLHRRSRVRALFRTLVEWRSRCTSIKVGAVGAKLRLGLNAREAARDCVYLDAGRAAAEEGLDFISLHARHAAQPSSSPPEWGAFARMRAALEEGSAHAGVCRPVLIANGNVRSRADADALVHSGGADGVMIARAAMYCPWIFSQFRGITGDKPPPSERTPSLTWGQVEWPSTEQVTEAEHTWASWASQGMGTREKHRLFHRANFARLRSPAARSAPTEAATEHL